MFRRVVAGTAVAVAAWLIPAVSGLAAAPPEHFGNGSRIAGDQRALYEAVLRPSAVRAELQVIEGPGNGDLTGYLDQWLEQNGWPQHDEILLLVFPGRNWDVRFALGSDFRRQGVTPAEMTALLRVHYFPRAQEGDPAGGLAVLLRQINRRVPVGEIE